MRNKQSKIKPIKVGKQCGTTYRFGCKDYTKNFRPEKVKMTNKILREKSHCVVCRSNKSRFLKQKYTYKNKMKTYYIKCWKDTENTDPKIVTTKNNRLVMQSKYSICGIKN